MPRYKTIEDIVKAYENAGFEIHDKDSTEYYLTKNIIVVKGKPHIRNRMSIFVTNLGGGVRTRITFPHIKRNFSGKTKGTIQRDITFNYEKTPEGLMLHSYEFEDKEHKVLSGEIFLTAEISV